MKTPTRLSTALEEIEPIVSSWPVDTSMDHVCRWVNQFEPGDYDLPVRIIKNLSILGTKELRSGLSAAYGRLSRAAAAAGCEIKSNNTVYAAMGEASKSGGLVAYHFRVIHDLPEDNFISNDDLETFDPRVIRNFILIDDIVGTGKTAAGEVKKLAEEVYPLQQEAKIYVVAACGYLKGIKNVIDSTGAGVFCGYEFDEQDTAQNLDGKFFDGLAYAARNELSLRLRKYNRQISMSELGHGNVGGVLAFEFNTPNTTLPAIWSRGMRWYPLFPRAMRFLGIQRFFGKIEEERKKQATAVQNVKKQRDSIDLTIFVEGKLDEFFFDYLIKNRDLAKKLNVHSVAPVALGGLYQSERLIELLYESRKDAILVLDGDQHTKELVERVPAFKKVPIIFFSPNFVELLDLTELLISDKLPKIVQEMELDMSNISEKQFIDLERALFKKGPFSEAHVRIAEILDKFLSLEKFELFIKSLNDQVEKLLAPRTAPPK